MENGITSDENHGENPLALINDLISRGKTLLSELQEFRKRIRTLRHEGIVETATFRGTVYKTAKPHAQAESREPRAENP